MALTDEGPSTSSLSYEMDNCMENMRRLSLPPSHRVLNARHRPSIVDAAEMCGLLDMSPSDLVCESLPSGFLYFDFVLSSAFHPGGGATVYLARFDTNTNLESLDATNIPAKIFEEVAYPETELALAVMGLLLYRKEVYNKRVLCLLRTTDQEQDLSASLESLKKTAVKLRVMHQVQAVRPRKEKSESRMKMHEGMRLRVMLCQSRQTEEEPPRKLVYEAKGIIEPSWNPFFCMCLWK